MCFFVITSFTFLLSIILISVCVYSLVSCCSGRSLSVSCSVITGSSELISTRMISSVIHYIVIVVHVYTCMHVRTQMYICMYKHIHRNGPTHKFNTPSHITHTHTHCMQVCTKFETLGKGKLSQSDARLLFCCLKTYIYISVFINLSL